MERRNAIAFIVLSAILLGCGRDELPLSEECLEFWQVKEGLFPKDDLKCGDRDGTTQWLSGSYGGDSNVGIRTCLCTNAAQAAEYVQDEPSLTAMGGLRWNLTTNVVGQLAITQGRGWWAFARNNVYVSVRARNSDLALKLCRKIDGYILKCLCQQRKRNQRESPEERYWRRGRELQQMSKVGSWPYDRSSTGAKWRVPQLFKTSGDRFRDGRWGDMVAVVRKGREEGWLEFYDESERVARCRVREFANKGKARDWMFAETASADLPLPTLVERMRVDFSCRNNPNEVKAALHLYPKGNPRTDHLYLNCQNVVVELWPETNADVCAVSLAEAFWARCEEIADKQEDGIEIALAGMTCKICPPYRISEICRHVPELRLSRVFGINDELIGRIVGSAKKGSWVEFAFKLDKPYGPFDEAKVELGGWTMEDRTLNLHRLKLVHQFDDEMSTAELQEAYRKVVQMVGESLGCDLPVPEFDPETPSKDRFYVDPTISLTLMPWSCTNRIFVNGRTPEYVQRNGKWILLGKPTVSVEFQFGRPYPPDPGPDGKPIVPKAISFGSDESRAFSAALRDKDYMYED